MAQIIDEADAAEAIATLKANGRFVVLHTGCYEVLHAGHIACFNAGKSFTSPGKRTCLVVGVESDSTLCLNREDKSRPLFLQDERASLIAQLNSVDLVLRFNPFLAADYADTTFFAQRLQKLAPDAFLVSYNDSLQYFQEIMQFQAKECAAAGVTILPVVHHVRTRATDAVDLLNRKGADLAASASGAWRPSYQSGTQNVS